jgi:regulator of RNase E activity RraA
VNRHLLIQNCLDLINNLNLSSTEVADAISKSGHIPLVKPLVPGIRATGIAHCIFVANGSNMELHKNLESAPPKKFLIIFSHNIPNDAIFGELVARYCFEHLQSQGLVVHGNLRDINNLRKLNLPIWYYGSSPIGVVNSPSAPYPVETKKDFIYKYENAVLIGDDSGVVAITNPNLNESILDKLKLIKSREAVWEYAIFRLGWSTYKTIVSRDYEQEYSEFPVDLQNKIFDLVRNKDLLP